MLEFVTNIENFWQEDLNNHLYDRKESFGLDNLSHLDKSYYNNGCYLQSFNDELPSAEDFKKALSVIIGSVSWTCVLPNSILPIHQDSFYTLRTQHNVDIAHCYRYLIFLKSWEFGQSVEFENMQISKWAVGDVWKFDHSERHYAVNASNSAFHTCQVSTFTYY